MRQRPRAAGVVGAGGGAVGDGSDSEQISVSAANTSTGAADRPTMTGKARRMAKCVLLCRGVHRLMVSGV